MKRGFHQKLCWLCRAGLGAIFISAAIEKLNAPQGLADSIAAYRLLPDAIINVLALALPLFEFICGLLLLTGILGRTALLGIIGMLALFLTALGTVIVRGLPVDCGCFGAGSWLGTSPGLAAARDIFLLICAIYAYAHYLQQSARPLASQKSTRISTA